MTASLLLLHLLELSLPAAVLALLMVGLSGWLWPVRSQSAGGLGWPARLGWTFMLNLLVLVAGLLWWGVDGKMATYGALLVVSALAQFIMGRLWRR